MQIYFGRVCFFICLLLVLLVSPTQHKKNLTYPGWYPAGVFTRMHWCGPQALLLSWEQISLNIITYIWTARESTECRMPLLELLSLGVFSTCWQQLHGDFLISNCIFSIGLTLSGVAAANQLPLSYPYRLHPSLSHLLTSCRVFHCYHKSPPWSSSSCLLLPTLASSCPYIHHHLSQTISVWLHLQNLMPLFLWPTHSRSFLATKEWPQGCYNEGKTYFLVMAGGWASSVGFPKTF